jgi:hypothetical protein
MADVRVRLTGPCTSAVRFKVDGIAARNQDITTTVDAATARRVLARAAGE